MSKYLVVENSDAKWYFSVNEIAADYASYCSESDYENLEIGEEGLLSKYQEYFDEMLNGPERNIKEWFFNNMNPEDILKQHKVKKGENLYWNPEYDVSSYVEDK